MPRHRFYRTAAVLYLVLAASLGAQTESPAEQLPPGQGAWANYDFLPGERILYADDFTGDKVGDFPRRLEFGQGSLEIVEWKGARYLRSSNNGYFVINLPEVLPQRFTLEADVLPRTGTGWGPPILVFSGVPKEAKGDAAAIHGATQEDDAPGFILFSTDEAGYVKGSSKSTTEIDESIHGQMYRLRVMADGDYVKVFVNERRVANVPNAKLGRSKQIHVVVNAAEDEPSMIGNIRIAAGGRDLYEALSASGRVATQGILFATGSDRIRPESTPTLKQIGDMLKTHATLKLAIEGHTDNVGDAASNKALSEKRAAAVKQYLVSTFGIDAARLTSAGLGDTKPAAPNTTPEGRQQNRRVELVKM